ncbi:hypothetical protein TRICI_005650 [Trichomonascus ciferrii]|uniref:Uncharacterized protein n=1 Tax=Trichomonascus ciferrii TaxID=44093 RepID=A0A642UV94_9ASCO|nr:hypothetical protein TRICI_005650 [Trichomonascus ciferrii]
MANQLDEDLEKWLRRRGYRSGNALVGSWCQMCRVPEEEVYSYDCDCGGNETIGHIIIDCPIREHSRHGLRAISDLMDLSVLLDTKSGLKSMAEFIQKMPKHTRNKLRTEKPAQQP